MEKYRFGDHLSMEEVLKNKEYYANLFSEGHLTLKALLLYCWNSNIDTYMCCEGDSNPEYDYNNDPFVIFNIPFEKKELIYKIISSVKNIPYLSYTMCQDDKDKKLYLDIRTPFYSKERSNELFNNLYEGITSQNYTYEVDIKLQKIVTVLTTVNNNAYKLTAKGGYERYKNDEDYLLWVTPIEMCKSPLHRAYYSNPITLKPEDILARDVDYYDRKMTK